jgi:hypothetical protein
VINRHSDTLLSQHDYTYDGIKGQNEIEDNEHPWMACEEWAGVLSWVRIAT